MDFDFKELFKNLKLLGGKEQRILGVDIGTSSIKVVQLRKEKERAILETYGEMAVGPYAKFEVGQAAKISEESMTQVLKDLLKEADIKAKTATVGIPLKSSFVTFFSLPASVQDNLSQVVEMEAKRYVPLPLSEVSLDWWVIPEEIGREISPEGEKKTNVLLVAIHKDAIDNFKKIIARANLKVRAYEIESFSMIRGCIGRETAPVVIIDFGASTAKIVVVDYGIMRMSHSLGHGSQELTLALSNSLSVDFTRAEEMKREIGLSELPEHREMVAVLEPVLDYIFSELNRLIMDYQNKSKRSVGKVILSGGGSLLKGLVGYSTKKFAIEVVLADPFAKTEYPVFLANVLKGIGPNFAIALGLALREL